MRNLVIVGANGALGRGVVKELLNGDFDKIYLIDRTPVEVNSKKTISLTVNDITSPIEVEKLFAGIEFEEGSENFLFSTVGGYFGGKTLSETDFSDWERMLKLNLDSVFLTAKYFLSNVPSNSTGSLLFTSALSSLSAEANKIAYNLSKAGINYLVESLSEEIFPNNYSVNAIAPFILDTPANREWMDDLSQMVSPEEIGQLIFSLFKNYRILSGNIIKLRGRILPK